MNRKLHSLSVFIFRTLGDENQWLAQKQTQLSSDNTTLSLLEVQKSLIRHQNITAEVEHRNARNAHLIKVNFGPFFLKISLKP